MIKVLILSKSEAVLRNTIIGEAERYVTLVSSCTVTDFIKGGMKNL